MYIYIQRINSEVMPTPISKRRMRTNRRRNASECAAWKSSAKFEKDVSRGRDYRSSRTRWHPKHSPIVGRVHTLRKCLVRDTSLKPERGEHNSENRGVKTYTYIHTTHISPNMSGQQVVRSRVWSRKVKSQKDRSNHPLPYKGSSRGGTIELSHSIQ